MNNNIKFVTCCLLSASLGSLVTFYILKNKYKNRLDEEIDSIKKVLEDNYSKKKSLEDSDVCPKSTDESLNVNRPQKDIDLSWKDSDKNEETYEPIDMSKITDYSKIYTSKQNNENKTKKRTNKNSGEEKEQKDIYPNIYKENLPRIISSNDFNMSDYEAVTYLYFKDGVVTDDDFTIITDIRGTIGYRAVEEMEKGYTDCIYVRNDGNKLDYELLRETKNYSEVMPRVSIVHQEDLDDE